MSNEEIKNVFNEVHNVFWVKWRDIVAELIGEMSERMEAVERDARKKEK